MKNIILTLALLFITNLIISQNKTYKGAWFDIKYPASFTAKGSLKSTTSEGYESAIFTSPDHSVEFYVFSPQWGGDPKDISVKKTEKVSDNKTQTSRSKILKWWTILAKDGSYTRSYQETTDNSSYTNLVFGVKYKSLLAYNKYKSQYLAFKSSLTQYAD